MRWEWEPGRVITIDADTVTIDDARSLPRVTTFSLEDAFESGSPLVYHPPTLAAVKRALAPRVPDSSRKRFWLGLPAEMPPRAAQWGEGFVELRGDVAYGPDEKWQLIDNFYLHGPYAPGIPTAVRGDLIAHLGADPADAFPALDHARIPLRDYEWNKSSDGQEDATLHGPTFTIGYRQGHDFGWTAHAVERFLTDAPDLYIGSMPDEMRREIRALIAAARL